ncbi:MAG: LUD domain-containing protein, partial [Desulfobacterales bacterium]
AAAVCEKVLRRTRQDRLGLLDRLIERAAITGMTVTPCRGVTAAARAMAALIRQESGDRGEAAGPVAWRHPLIDRLMLEPALAVLMPPAHPQQNGGENNGLAEAPRRRVRQQTAAAPVGIISAEWCLADTATLVSRTRPGCDRSIAVVPPVTVAVVPLDHLVADLKELYALLRCETPASVPRLTNYMSLISGPSTTRDIESIPVTGAHGPRAVTVLVLV